MANTIEAALIAASIVFAIGLLTVFQGYGLLSAGACT
jgi:hypothetical protein